MRRNIILYAILGLLLFTGSLFIGKSHCIGAGIDIGFPITFFARCNEVPDITAPAYFKPLPLLVDISAILLFVFLFDSFRKLISLGWGKIGSTQKLLMVCSIAGLIFGLAMLYIALEHNPQGKFIDFQEQLVLREILRVPIAWWTIGTLVTFGGSFTIRFIVRKLG